MQISDDILKHKTGFLEPILFPKEGGGNVLNHRKWIIMRALDLENALMEALLQWLRSSNVAMNGEKARRDLFEEGPLRYLKAMAAVALHAGMIGPKTRHDLGKFADLRNRYAHDRHRKQLDEDPKMLKLLTDTYLYRENRERLENLGNMLEQKAMFAISEQLRVIIEEGIVE